MLILGFVGGLLLASALSVGVIYLLFGDKLENKVESIEKKSEYVEPNQDVTYKTELERVKLDAMQKERDAALAITKALERERDAALATAKAQESMRNVEMRAAEIIAEQERKAAVALKKANRRARQAELEAEQAQANEHKAKIQAMQSIIEAEKKKDSLIKSAVVVEKPKVIQVAPTVEKVPVKTDKKAESKESKFSANPCSSPSSKFLSTCKK